LEFKCPSQTAFILVVSNGIAVTTKPSRCVPIALNIAAVRTKWDHGIVPLTIGCTVMQSWIETNASTVARDRFGVDADK